MSPSSSRGAGLKMSVSRGRKVWLLSFLWGQDQQPSCPRPMALALRWLVAGGWPGPGDLLDLAPESKLLPAGPDQLRSDPWVLPFLYLQTQSMAGPVTGSWLKVHRLLRTRCLSGQVAQKLQEPPPARPAPLNCSPQADTAIFPGCQNPSMSSNCSEDKAQPPSHPSLCGLCDCSVFPDPCVL